MHASVSWSVSFHNLNKIRRQQMILATHIAHIMQSTRGTDTTRTMQSALITHIAHATQVTLPQHTTRIIQITVAANATHTYRTPNVHGVCGICVVSVACMVRVVYVIAWSLVLHTQTTQTTHTHTHTHTHNGDKQGTDKAGLDVLDLVRCKAEQKQ